MGPKNGMSMVSYTVKTVQRLSSMADKIDGLNMASFIEKMAQPLSFHTANTKVFGT